MPETSLLLRTTGAIISLRMATYMCRRALDGSTVHCIPYNFLQIFHREIDMDSVHAVLEGNALHTQRSVPHGETQVEVRFAIGEYDEDGQEINERHWTWHPDGALSDIAFLAATEESDFIARYLNLKYSHTKITYTPKVCRRGSTPGR